MQRRLMIVGGMAVGLVVFSSTAWAKDSDSALSVARQTLFSASNDLENIEINLSRTRVELGNVVAKARYFPTERRILDADLFFESADYEGSATLYRDLADNPSFKGQPGYYRVLFQLGESLFRSRNYMSAGRYFKLAGVLTAGSYYGQAVSRLFEVAVKLNDYSICQELEPLVESGAIKSPEVLYSYGKYLFSRGLRDRALSILAKVEAGAKPYFRARYFMGVVEAVKGNRDMALAYFTTAAEMSVETSADRDARGAALLAKGRILYLSGKVPEALLALQQVDERSSAFSDSLFDSAWAYLDSGDLQSAVHALDVLLMTEDVGELALRGSALRGRILTRLKDRSAAEGSYQEVSETIGPVAEELDRVVRDRKAMLGYFNYLMGKSEKGFEVELPISNRTSKWIEGDAGMAAIVAMFRDLSHERDDIQEAFEIMEKLLWALKSGGEFEAFPALKERYLVVKGLEGRFLGVAVQAADAMVSIATTHIKGDVAAQYEAAVKSRQPASQVFAKGPRSFDEYKKREDRLGTEYQEIGRKLFLIEAILRIESQQVVGIEQWLRERRMDGESSHVSADREKEIRKELGPVKAILAEFRKEADALRNRMEQASVTVNSPKELDQERAVRQDLMSALAAEAKALRAGAATTEGNTAQAMQTAADLIERAIKGVSSTGPLIASVEKIAGAGAKELAIVVTSERKWLQETVAEIAKAEMDSKEFAESAGIEVFRGVRDRLNQVLLEADLGLVDMVWEREQEASARLQTLGKDRADKMKGVSLLEKILESERASEESAKAAKTPEG